MFLEKHTKNLQSGGGQGNKHYLYDNKLNKISKSKFNELSNKYKILEKREVSLKSGGFRNDYYEIKNNKHTKISKNTYDNYHIIKNNIIKKGGKRQKRS